MSRSLPSRKSSRWTIYVCPRCGFMDPDQFDREGREPRHCPFSFRGLSRDGELLHPYRSDPDFPVLTEFEPVTVIPEHTNALL